MSHKLTHTVLIFALITSCSSRSSEEKELLKKAYQKQQQAIELIENIEQTLEQSTYTKRDSLQEVIEELEEELFEVPGYSLELSGHEGHDHSHSRIELSAEEIYKVQEELLKQLNQIQTLLKYP